MSARSWTAESSRRSLRADVCGCVAGSRSAAARGLRLCIPRRLKSWTVFDARRATVNGTEGWRTKSVARCLRKAAAATALALTLAACAMLSDRQVLLPGQTKQAEAPTAGQREHLRILAAYGGAYEDPKLEAQLSQTLERLVAASDRPDLHYRITILNSPAVNAFALPSGQLYVTRGLTALANDNAELASVLAHEMAHVIARHAAIREDQAKQAAIVGRVVNDVLSDPQMGALALAKSKIALATFSRAQEFEADGIGVGISSRAGFDPYGGARFLTSMGRNAELKSSPSQSHNDPRA